MYFSGERDRHTHSVLAPGGPSWLQSLEHAIPDLGGVRSSPMLGTERTLGKKKKY